MYESIGEVVRFVICCGHISYQLSIYMTIRLQLSQGCSGRGWGGLLELAQSAFVRGGLVSYQRCLMTTCGVWLGGRFEAEDVFLKE